VVAWGRKYWIHDPASGVEILHKNAANRNLLLCSLPSFLLIADLLFSSYVYWPGGDLWAMSGLGIFIALEFISPLCVIVGWILFREDKRLAVPIGTTLGRNILIVATVMATPLPLYVIGSLLYGLFKVLHMAN
jgi:hypothetical protein